MNRTHEIVASWILRNKTTKQVICETYDYQKVLQLNTEKYEAIPVQDYLAEFNKKA